MERARTRRPTNRAGPVGPVGPAFGWWFLRAVLAVAVRPGLWWTGIRQVRLLAPTGWWQAAPYLPLPDPAYLAFRMQTQYGGDGTTPPDPADVVRFLEWCRRMRRLGA